MSIEIGSRIVITTGEFEDEHGTVVEILSGKISSTEVVEAVLDNGESVWTRKENIIEEAELKEGSTGFEVKIDVADNLVVVMLFKNGREIGRGHGHVIHTGDIGIAQAISYGCKRIYENMGGQFNGK